MFCKYCGENNVDGAKFCKNCGKPLMTTSSADGTAAGYNPEMTPGYTPTSQQNHKKTGIIAIVAIDRCSSDFFNFPCGKRTQPGKNDRSACDIAV